MRLPLSGVKVPIPNPHRGDIDWSLAKRVLAQAGVALKDYERVAKH
jgi:hypothetical protein